MYQSLTLQQHMAVTYKIPYALLGNKFGNGEIQLQTINSEVEIQRRRFIAIFSKVLLRRRLFVDEF